MYDSSSDYKRKILMVCIILFFKRERRYCGSTSFVDVNGDVDLHIKSKMDFDNKTYIYIAKVCHCIERK